MPRCAGLRESDEKERFDTLYKRFDEDLYSGSFTAEAVAVLHGFTDNTGYFRNRNGFTLRYYMPPVASLPLARLRDEMVPHLEFRRASFDRFDEKGTVLVMHYEMQMPLRDGAVRDALRISHDTIKKFVLATRILLNTPVFSDFRGYRVPGSRCAGNFLLEHFWWEKLDSNNTPQLTVQIRLEKLLECLTQTPYDKFAVVDWKIEDALRRYQHVFLKGRRTEKHIEIEQLLDYVQAIEAMLQVGAGRASIAEFAALLLADSPNMPKGISTFDEIYPFVYDMYEFRNEVAHGRMDGVIKGTFAATYGNKINIWRLQLVVSELAILFLANLPTGVTLRRAASLIKKKKPMALSRL